MTFSMGQPQINAETGWDVLPRSINRLLSMIALRTKAEPQLAE